MITFALYRYGQNQIKNVKINQVMLCLKSFSIFVVNPQSVRRTAVVQNRIGRIGRGKIITSQYSKQFREM